MPRFPLIALLATAGVAPLAGCASEEPGRVAAAKPAPAASAGVEVELSASQFSPATAHARVGEAVTFVNRDALAHTATATAGARFDSGAIGEGDRFSFTPARAGTIALVCTFHPGMTGWITVT